LLLLAVAGMSSAGLRVQAQRPEPATVARIGDYVERYFARAQSILADETVTVQPLTSGQGFDGFPRRLVYEMRLEWDPGSDETLPAAKVMRRLISATGPRLGPPEQPDCMDPRAVSPEPLALLLPAQRHKYRFTMAGSGRVDKRLAVRVDYRPLVAEPPQVDWEGECGKIEVPGRIRGRIWADPSTSEILRFDEALVGEVELPPHPKRRPGSPLSFTLERADSSTYYQPVSFRDPDETLLLPVRLESVTVIRNSGVPRLRVTHQLTNYRRFVTSSRILP
jgi:hypothetical protein